VGYVNFAPVTWPYPRNEVDFNHTVSLPLSFNNVIESNVEKLQKTVFSNFRTRLFENLRMLPHAPSVQVIPVRFKKF
jgi:hypothetical protein